MRKSDLVDLLARDYPNLEKEAVRMVVDRTFEELVGSLKKGKRVEIRGFGIFQVKSRDSRSVKIPNRPVAFKIPPRRMLTFKASSLLLKRLNHGSR